MAPRFGRRIDRPELSCNRRLSHRRLRAPSAARRAEARDEIIARRFRAAADRPAFLGDRQRTLRLPQERREAGLQARRLRRAGRGRGARHRAGRDDPAGREVRRPAGRRAAAAVPAHPLQRDDGLVPAPEGAQRGRAQLLRLRGAPATTAISTSWKLSRRSADSLGSRRAPPTRCRGRRSCRSIEAEVAQLPARQREAFLLRYWEELDVAETAAVHGLLGRAASRRTARGRCMPWRRP